MFFNFRYCILLLQWNLNVTKGHGTGKLCLCPFPLWFYYYWGKENRSGYSEDYVILRFHCSTIRCVGSNYFWLVKGPFKCVNIQISLPFQILQHKKSLHFIYPMPEKGTPFVGGGGGGRGFPVWAITESWPQSTVSYSWANLKTKICKMIAFVTPPMLLVSHTDTPCPCLP